MHTKDRRLKQAKNRKILNMRKIKTVITSSNNLICYQECFPRPLFTKFARKEKKLQFVSEVLQKNKKITKKEESIEQSPQSQRNVPLSSMSISKSDIIPSQTIGSPHKRTTQHSSPLVNSPLIDNITPHTVYAFRWHV